MTLEIDLKYPEVLSTGYFLIGPPRHTISLHFPIRTEELLPSMTDLRWSAAAWRRFDELGFDAELPPEWREFEAASLARYRTVLTEAGKLLDSGRRDEAVRRLNETATAIWKAAEKLRQEHPRAAGMNIDFQYYPEYEPIRLDGGGWTAATINFETPTSNTGRMLSAITPKLRGIFIPGRRYKKSGVLFFGLESEMTRQVDLFADTAGEEKDDRLSKALDAINAKYGRGTIFHLSEGIAKPWQMKREMLTPNYTTSWNQIPKVK